MAGIRQGSLAKALDLPSDPQSAAPRSATVPLNLYPYSLASDDVPSVVMPFYPKNPPLGLCPRGAGDGCGDSSILLYCHQGF